MTNEQLEDWIDEKFFNFECVASVIDVDDIAALMEGNVIVSRNPQDDIVDHHIDAVLKASGSALKNYELKSVIENMREAMRKAMTQE